MQCQPDPDTNKRPAYTERKAEKESEDVGEDVTHNYEPPES
jgi:hypothetical protein